MFHALTFHATSSTMRGNALFFAQGVAQGGAAARARRSSRTRSSSPSAFVRTSQATDVPDLQLHLLPWSYVSPNQDEPIRHDVDPRPSLTVLSTLIYPRSRGTLRLAVGRPDGGAADRLPATSPTPPTSTCWPRGRRWSARSWPARPSAARSRRRSTPAPACRGRTLRDAILNRATSVYHGVGTCRMGVDELRGGRSRPQGPGHRRAAGLRRLDHAVDHRRQHQRARDHDRRAGRGPRARNGS